MPIQKYDPIHIRWPLAARLYTLLFGGPMAIISLGLVPWMFDTRFGSMLEPYRDDGVNLLLTTFSISMVFAGTLFFSSYQRVAKKKPDGLTLAATGHLMVAAPAITVLVIDFLYNAEFFWLDLTTFFNTGDLTLEWLLIAWVMLHIYSALFLSLYDNSSIFINRVKSSSPSNNPTKSQKPSKG